METNLTFETILIQLLKPIIKEAITEALSSITYHQPSPHTPISPASAVKDIFTVGEAAEFLGSTKSYLYKLTHFREIPHYKSGKRLYFKREDLVLWMTRLRIKTHEEIEQEAITFLTTRKRKF
jgi:excisionase family DNA binding protein